MLLQVFLKISAPVPKLFPRLGTVETDTIHDLVAFIARISLHPRRRGNLLLFGSVVNLKLQRRTTVLPRLSFFSGPRDPNQRAPLHLSLTCLLVLAALEMTSLLNTYHSNRSKDPFIHGPVSGHTLDSCLATSVLCPILFPIFSSLLSTSPLLHVLCFWNQGAACWSSSPLDQHLLASHTGPGKTTWQTMNNALYSRLGSNYNDSSK